MTYFRPETATDHTIATLHRRYILAKQTVQLKDYERRGLEGYREFNDDYDIVVRLREAYLQAKKEAA